MLNNVNIPEISIITANYNSEKFIVETIESVKNQTFKNWEMIIIDDNSSDKGVEVIEAYCLQDNRIKLLKNKTNLGPAKTRNRGLEMTKGRYVCFLDSDDIWYEMFLETSLNFLQKNNVAFVFSSYDRRDENLKEDKGTFFVPQKVSYADILKTCPISCLTAMYDTSVTGKVLMPDILKRQDFALWLQILKKVSFAYGINKPMAIYRMRNNSVSRNKFHAAKYQWNVYRDVEGIGVFRSVILLLHWAKNGLNKYL